MIGTDHGHDSTALCSSANSKKSKRKVITRPWRFWKSWTKKGNFPPHIFRAKTFRLRAGGRAGVQEEIPYKS